MVWKKIGECGAIPKGEGGQFELDGRLIAVVHQDGFYALDATCAHQNQSIACGKIEGKTIECPHHFWHYDYTNGKLLDYLQGVSLRTYPVEERSDGLYVDA